MQQEPDVIRECQVQRWMQDRAHPHTPRTEGGRRRELLSLGSGSKSRSPPLVHVVRQAVDRFYAASAGSSFSPVATIFGSSLVRDVGHQPVEAFHEAFLRRNQAHDVRRRNGEIGCLIYVFRPPLRVALDQAPQFDQRRLPR